MTFKFMIVRVIISFLIVKSVPFSFCIDKATYVNIRLRDSSRLLNSEHVSLEFYASSVKATSAKSNLQRLFQNFLENLQRNLTTSAVLKSPINAVDLERTQHKLSQINNLLTFFQTSSFMIYEFAEKSEQFFHMSKNQSNELLLKLRQVPSAERSLPTQKKMQLTLYFAEMEFFHVMFSEIIDEALEYIVDTLQVTHVTFNYYTDIQTDILRYWSFQADEWCCNQYMNFLQKWSAHIYKCAADPSLNTVYDVFAMTEVTIKHVIWQLQFRIQRLYNCFLFGEYEIRCGFLRNAENDFEKLFAKLEELQMYLDIKTKHGRVSINRDRSQGIYEDNNINYIKNACIPFGFPENQMPSSLKMCFNFPEFS